MATRRAYNKVIKAEKSSEKSEPVVEVREQPDKEDIREKEIESLAFQFIAGDFGSSTDVAAKRISELGFDPEEVIGTGIKILKGEYFNQKG